MSPREGQKPIHFWAEESLKENFDEWLRKGGGDITGTLKCVMAALTRLPPDQLAEIKRLAAVHRLRDEDMLARIIQEGLKVEEARIVVSPAEKPGKRR